jgi:hypothetical protein
MLVTGQNVRLGKVAITRARIADPLRRVAVKGNGSREKI